MHSIRHGEGQIHAHLNKHTSAVSVLRLNRDETSVISGGWDKNIYEWDLNTGSVVQNYAGSTGQLSVIAWRPENDTTISASVFSQKYDTNEDEATDKRAAEGDSDMPTKKEDDSDSMGSLFGDDDDEDEEKQGLSSELMDHDVISASIESKDELATEGVGESEAQLLTETLKTNGVKAGDEDKSIKNGEQNDDNNNTNSLGGGTVVVSLNGNGEAENNKEKSSNNVFLSASIDGKSKIWDRRVGKCIADIGLQSNVPPWCTSACWSLDGNSVYFGRRNGVVEEYSIHASLDKPVRTLKLPAGSGPVSCVTPMPNGRHLVCASFDNIRLYDLQQSVAGSSMSQSSSVTSKVPFLIVPGHHGGTISDVVIDHTSKYMITTGGNKGWEGSATEVMLVYEIEKIL